MNLMSCSEGDAIISLLFFAVNMQDIDKDYIFARETWFKTLIPINHLNPWIIEEGGGGGEINR